MKKQTKILLGIVLAIVVVLVAVSLFYPPVYNRLTSGTFGKAEKYRKEQMSERDIQLRSEFVTDTASLRTMIQSLVYFSLFTQDLSFAIDTCVNSYRRNGAFTEKNPASKSIELLADYSEFIRNNNKTLAGTISMLTAFYLKDTTDQSVDVEKNLRDFGNYVVQLSQKDSVVELALASMDKYLLGKAIKQNKKTEFVELKSIRDQLLIKGIQLSGIMCDRDNLKGLLQYSLSSQLAFNTVNSVVSGSHGQLKNLDKVEQLSAATLKSELACKSTDELKNVLSQSLTQESRSMGQVGELQALKGHLCGVVYKASDMQFSLKSGDELKKIIGSNEIQFLVPVAFFGDKINLFYGQFDLKMMTNAKELSGFLSGSAFQSMVRVLELSGFLKNLELQGFYSMDVIKVIGDS